MTTKTSECNVTMRAKFDPNHTHTCTGSHHEEADHYCNGCGRFWKPATERGT